MDQSEKLRSNEPQPLNKSNCLDSGIFLFFNNSKWSAISLSHPLNPPIGGLLCLVDKFLLSSNEYTSKNFGSELQVPRVGGFRGYNCHYLGNYPLKGAITCSLLCSSFPSCFRTAKPSLPQGVTGRGGPGFKQSASSFSFRT